MGARIIPLIRLILRRDRIKLPVWIVGIVLTLLAMVPLLRETYGDADSLTTLYETFSINPAGLFITGPMDAATFGGLMTIETAIWWGVAVAFMNILLVVRHTRQNEESGAQELIGSAPVHRTAGLTGVLTVALGVNLLIAAGVGMGMVWIDQSWSVESGLLYGLALGLHGLAWAAVAAVVVQLFESTRSAVGVLSGFIGLSFVLRGIGDFMGKVDAAGLLQPSWLSWLSPAGWLQSVRALTFPDWTGLIAPAVFALVAIPIAYVLLSSRDVGAGILPSRKGRSRARRFLKTLPGLVWHLQKNVFIGWTIGVLLMSAIIGFLVPEMSHIYENSESMQSMISAMAGDGELIATFLSAMLSIVVLMVLAYVIQSLSKLASEESSGNSENLYAASVSRFGWLGWHVVATLVGGALLLAMSGAVLATFVNLGTDIEVDLVEYLLSGLSYFPVLVFFAGLYVAIFGLIPVAANLTTWLYYGFVVFVLWLAPMLGLDEMIMDASVMSHVAAAPVQDINLAPLLALSLVGTILIVLGFLWFRQRDIVSR